MLGHLKWLLTLLGARFSDHALLQLQAFINYLRIGRWMYNQGLFFPDRVSSREDVWAAMITKLRNQKVLYMEFGVAYGESISYWSRELKNPASALHGFDSFEGLPEHYQHGRRPLLVYDIRVKLPPASHKAWDIDLFR
jgi:hypothetical protein